MAARRGSAARQQLSDPCRFWIRYRPSRWPWPESTDRRCLDLSALDLSPSRRRRGDEPAAIKSMFAALEEERFDDVLYLPPVPFELEERRRRVAERHRERGTPVIYQVVPGDGPPPPGCIGVADLLPSWLAGVEPESAIESLPAVRCAAVPLIAGLGPRTPDDFSLVCRRLRGAGYEVAQAMPLEIEPRRRRSLVEGVDGRSFLGLFHAERPSEQTLVAAAVAAGLAPFVDRPVPSTPERPSNLRIAGRLALAAELATRIDRSPDECQALLRAARWSERTPHDLESLRREGNLDVLPWLEPPARRIVEEVTDGVAGTVERYLERYVERRREHEGSTRATTMTPDRGKSP